MTTITEGHATEATDIAAHDIAAQGIAAPDVENQESDAQEALEAEPQGDPIEDEPQRPETDHIGQRIDVLRNQIDAVDDALIRLIEERVSLSKNVGALRRAGGGPRLSLTRENQIIAKFGRALGASGTPLAMLVLKISRGRM